MLFRNLALKSLRDGLANRNSRNVIAAVLQVGVDFISVVLNYAIALKYCAMEEIGAWAFVTAWMTFSRVSDVSIAPTVACFVAKYKSTEDNQKVASTIVGGMRRVAWNVGISSTLVFTLLAAYIVCTTETSKQTILLQLGTVCWLYIVLLALSTSATSALDGLKRTDLRATTALLASVVRILLTALAASKFGILGFAMGLIAHSATMLLLANVFLRKELPSVSWSLRKDNGKWSDDLIDFGRKYRVSGILQLALEPSTKVVFPFFAGLESLGIFDIATRLVQQVRAAIVAPMSNLLPIFSTVSENHRDERLGLYVRASRLSFLSCSCFFSMLICAIPILGQIWLGDGNTKFTAYGSVLSFSWGINAFSCVAYYYLLAVGQLQVVRRSNLYMASVNIIAGVVGGLLFGGIGCAIGVSLAIASGSVILVLGANQHLKLSFGGLLCKSYVIASLTSFVTAGAALTKSLYSSESQNFLEAVYDFAPYVVVCFLCHLFALLCSNGLFRLTSRVRRNSET